MRKRASPAKYAPGSRKSSRDSICHSGSGHPLCIPTLGSVSLLGDCDSFERRRNFSPSDDMIEWEGKRGESFGGNCESLY